MLLCVKFIQVFLQVWGPCLHTVLQMWSDVVL